MPFDSSHQNVLIMNTFTFVEKIKINKKRRGMAHLQHTNNYIFFRPSRSECDLGRKDVCRSSSGFIKQL